MSYTPSHDLVNPNIPPRQPEREHVYEVRYTHYNADLQKAELRISELEWKLEEMEQMMLSWRDEARRLRDELNSKS